MQTVTVSGLLSTPRRRTVAGLALAAAFIPVMLSITACLDTPIGDPEQGWVDPRITGIWLAGDPEPKDYAAALWSIEPYDSRTWLVTWAGFDDAQDEDSDAMPETQESPSAARPDARPGAGPEASAAPLEPVDMLRILATLTEDRAEPGDTYFFKAWLTSIGDRRFLVLEPKVVVDAERGFRAEGWFAFRLVLKGDRIELALIEGLDDDEGPVTTRGQTEQYIARHAADPDLYGEPTTFYRLPRSSYDDVAEVLARAGLPQW